MATDSKDNVTRNKGKLRDSEKETRRGMSEATRDYKAKAKIFLTVLSYGKEYIPYVDKTRLMPIWNS